MQTTVSVLSSFYLLYVVFYWLIILVTLFLSGKISSWPDRFSKFFVNVVRRYQLAYKLKVNFMNYVIFLAVAFPLFCAFGFWLTALISVLQTIFIVNFSGAMWDKFFKHTKIGCTVILIHGK